MSLHIPVKVDVRKHALAVNKSDKPNSNFKLLRKHLGVTMNRMRMVTDGR